MLPEPPIEEFIRSAKVAIQGQGAREADFIRGSEYESLMGASAIIWSREAQRDTDLFRATRLQDATGKELTNLVKQRFNIDRYLDTRGSGTAILSRPSPGLADTVWIGTRIRVGNGKLYRVTATTPVAATDTQAKVLIEATEVGLGARISINAGAFLDDPLTDPTWTVARIDCADGTVFEPASDLVARVRRIRQDSRVGYPTAIINACKAAGASQTVVLRSDFGGDALDAGLNVTYVGDSGYQGSASLVRACTVSVRQARVNGDCMQVLPMARVQLDIAAVVTLTAAPANFDLSRLETIHFSALRQALNGSSGDFGYTRIGLMTAIAKNSPEVQDVTFIAPLSDAGILVSGNFPAVLNRYVVGNISLKYVAP